MFARRRSYALRESSNRQHVVYWCVQLACLCQGSGSEWKCEKILRAPSFVGGGVTCRPAKPTPNTSESGVLDENVGRHKVVVGLVNRARNLCLFFPTRPIFNFKECGEAERATGPRCSVHIWLCYCSGCSKKSSSGCNLTVAAKAVFRKKTHTCKHPARPVIGLFRLLPNTVFPVHFSRDS